ncbi:hypothetical protein VITFI_CDS2796 [Vitreoscilla filiformis]|uniref:Uncharacterized protein n=1 Tax=Vitreoscilla filiformis TaxID=63 RepID=A0A221KIB4_VITFI|nr:hypothetical protein VITFI_CDS2796 [Vitreoscilla filiformis]
MTASASNALTFEVVAHEFHQSNADGIAMCRCDGNPVPDLKGVLKPQTVSK